MKKPTRRKGFDQGGQISSDSIGKGIEAGANMALSGYSAYQRGKYYETMADAAKARLGTTGPAQGPVGGDVKDGMARGGKIKRVAGKPIGKDDGLIPAQKGEYVVRKSAVNKLGTKALNQINRGKIPARKGR